MNTVRNVLLFKVTIFGFGACLLRFTLCGSCLSTFVFGRPVEFNALVFVLSGCFDCMLVIVAELIVCECGCVGWIWVNVRVIDVNECERDWATVWVTVCAFMCACADCLGVCEFCLRAYGLKRANFTCSVNAPACGASVLWNWVCVCGCVCNICCVLPLGRCYKIKHFRGNIFGRFSAEVNYGLPLKLRGSEFRIIFYAEH